MRAKPNTRNGKNVKTNSSNNSSNNSNKFSVKKPLKENVSTSNQPDNSVLRPPVDTSIAGLKQAVKLFETGTPEIIHLLSFECDVIYECRVCRNLFRSIANFISHKRVYCTRRFNHVQTSPVVEDHTVLVEEGSSETGPTLPLRITARQDLTSILQTSPVQYYKEVEDKLISRDVNRCDSTIHLQPIESTTYGVYQTVGKKNADKLIKNQVSELNKIISKNEEAIIGPDGKIIREGAGCDDKTVNDEHVIVDDLVCQLCKIKFSSKKTLSHHTKTVHDSFRVCYSCPCCKNLFSNTWSVHRHLYKVHRKSSEQVRRLRAQIQKKQVRAEKLAEKFNRKSDPSKTKKEENKAWMEHFEDDSELQRCGGCGRRFERRAALTSHAQICHKRIAACNSMQAAKRKEDKSSEMQSDLVPIKQQTAQGSPVQKVQSEKRIGIQVRMNYCKSTVGSPGIETRRSERHKSCEEKEEEISDALSSDSILRDRLLSPSTESIDRIKFEGMRDSEEKSSSNGDGETALCPSSFKRNNLARKTNKSDNKIKTKRLESMCTQLRKAAAGLECEESEKFEKSQVSTSIKSDSTNPDNKKSKDVTSTKNKDNKSKLKQNENTTDNKSETTSQKTEDGILNDLTSKTCTASSSKEYDGTIDSDFSSLNNKSIEFPNDRLKNDANNESDNFETLSSTENIDEHYLLFKSLEKTDSGVKDLFDNETNCVEVGESKLIIDDIHSSSLSEATDKGGAKDSVGILTRYKVRTIFKSDSSSIADNLSNNEISDQEELSITDESSLKENLNESLSNDQPIWMQKKMSQYIRYKNKQCLICLKKFKMLLHIKQHVADHLGWNNYHCLFSNCSYATFSKNDCIKHLMKTHLKAHEKHRASSLVGELGQIKSDNCDIDVKCDLNNLNKRKKPDTEEFRCMSQTVLKESAETEFKVLDKDSVTLVSINDDSSEIILAEECVHTSKGDSSSEQSDIEPRTKKKFKRRKIGNYEKHNPPVRKCSPDSTTELAEKEMQTVAVGAQCRDEVELPDVVVISDSGDDTTSFAKLEEMNDKNQYNKVVSNIPVNRNHVVDQHVNGESVDSDTQGKGRDTEEEDEMQDIGEGNNANMLDDGNLRRLVMEVIFGGQVSTNTNSKQHSESELQK